MKKIAYIVVGAVAVLLVSSMVITACVWPMINEVETGMTPEYPEIQPHYYSTSPDRIYEEALAAVDDLESWTVVSSESATFEIEAERTTRVFRFVDDVTIRVEPVTEFVSQVYVRSASRVGRSDLGQNARNIEEFFVELDQRLGAVKFEPGAPQEDEVPGDQVDQELQEDSQEELELE